MRGLKSTLALGVVLIGLVAYIYFVDRNKPTSDALEVKAKAFTVESGAAHVSNLGFRVVCVPVSRERLLPMRLTRP